MIEKIIVLAVLCLVKATAGNVAELECPPSGTSDLLPMPDDCTSFYQCVDGELYILQCEEGLHFNPDVQVCDYPWVAGCDESWTSPIWTETPDWNTTEPNWNSTETTEWDTTEPNWNSTETTEWNTTEPNWNSTETPEGNSTTPNWDCPSSGISNLLPVPDDCTSFYQCIDGVIYVLHCEEGLHFNPEQEVCDYPWLAGCDDSWTSPNGTETPIEPTWNSTETTDWNTTEPNWNSTETPEGNSTTPTWDCPSSGISNLLPVPDDCTSFYQCIDGVIHILHCEEGLHFNPDQEVCDFPWLAGCDDSYTSQ